VFHEFSKHFIGAGLVDKRFKKLIKAAKKKDYTQLKDREHQVYELASTMENLYASMDDSLGFPAEKEQELKAQNRIESVLDDNDDVFRDYRGVPCPMNFVKVKLDLAMMESGQLLKVFLDEGEPIANVPRSVADEGHEIVNQKKENDFWSVFIRKA
jgi:sulfite reductase (ferredoxin)